MPKKLPQQDRLLIRIATAVHLHWSACRSAEPRPDLPIERWEQCLQAHGKIRRTELRGWNLAKARLADDFRQLVGSLAYDITSVQRDLYPSCNPPSAPTVRDIHRDLQALQHGFEEFDCKIAPLCISVVTEPIELEGVYLGPFEIRLQYRSRHDPPSYRVIARDPHPAECRENVTHPHVMDDVLCEGDGCVAIRRALEQGRLFDFFTIVMGVLRHYNAESPFVELALWRGRPCSDCGSLLDDDECGRCHKCEDRICDACATMCGGCEEWFCAQCLDTCGTCDESCCRRCLTKCRDCEQQVCAGCLDEQERCPNCHEDESNETEEACPENQSHGLGQVAVST